MVMAIDAAVAMVQMRADGGRREENVDRACAAIHEAAASGADVVVLPEAMDLGWTHASARRLASPVPAGFVCSRLREAARAARVHVCSGLVEAAGDRIYNAAVLIGPDGDVLLHHRKIAELDIARDLYDIGDRLAVASTMFGITGILICADSRAPRQALAGSLGAMGARLILSPCSWAVEPAHDNERHPYGGDWEEAYRAMALEHGMTTVAVSNVGRIEGGPWDGWRCIGNSLAVGSDGAVVATAPHGVDAECIVHVRV
jgi:predicted amidohydrolase